MLCRNETYEKTNDGFHTKSANLVEIKKQKFYLCNYSLRSIRYGDFRKADA